MNKAIKELAHVWAEQNSQAICYDVLSALAVAIEDRDTWLRVSCWNGSLKTPSAAVASLLRASDNGRGE